MEEAKPRPMASAAAADGRRTIVRPISLLLLPVIFIGVTSASNLALLSGTLKTFQTFACEGQPLIIKCPSSTTVNVQVVQYGQPSPSQAQQQPKCPTPTAGPATQGGVTTGSSGGSSSASSSSSSTTTLSSSSAVDGLVVPGDSAANSSAAATACLNTMQYKLLQKVVEACVEQQQCKVSTSIEGGNSESCPGFAKHVEVAFKCRPKEFPTKIICEGEQLQVKCRKGTRIAIYLANFGRGSHGSLECPQPEGVPEEECQASYATETLMRICHGNRKCTIKADIETFGNPCGDGTKHYLRVMYACVPSRVLKNMYQDLSSGSDDDSPGDGDEDLIDEASYAPPVDEGDQDILGNRMDAKSTKPPKKKPPSEFPPTPVPPTSSLTPPSLSGTFVPIVTTGRDVQGDDSDEKSNEKGDQDNCTDPGAPSSQRDVTIGLITEWISAYNFLKDNTEKLILYLSVSISAGLVLFLMVVVGRLIVQKRQERRRANLNISDPLPNGFGDDASDIDQDITDLSHCSPRMEPNVEVVRYNSRPNTMRRQDSDTNPRAPMARTHNNYYYS